MKNKKNFGKEKFYSKSSSYREQGGERKFAISRVAVVDNFGKNLLSMH
jgi:hypothetical protein